MVAFALNVALPAIGTRGASLRCSRTPPLMTLSEKPQKQFTSLDNARRILNSDQKLDDVKDVMQGLQQRRDELAVKIDAISAVMDELRALAQPKETFVDTALDSVMQVFATPKDNYPSTGIPSGYTMDPPKKK